MNEDRRSTNAWEYIDLDLEIDEEKGARKYPVEVRSAEGEAHAEMSFPFDQWELKDKLKEIELALLKSGEKRRRLGTAEEKTVQEFGRALFNSLLVGEVGAHYRMSIREARRQRKGLRLKLHVRPPELSALPWEFLYDPGRDYLVLSSTTPLVRYLDLPQPVERLTVAPPLKILGMVASPQGLVQLDVEHEKRLMDQATKELRADGMVELSWLGGQSWRHLQRAMRRGEWHIFHFIGHGGFDPVSEEGAVALANDEGRKDLLGAAHLARLLDDHFSLRLVFLNSCEGARGSERNAFSSTAATLVRCGIPAVVAMQYEITDEAAIEFSRTFYDSVADGLPVDAAVAEARTAVSVTSKLEWGTPVLYMRSSDGLIFDIQQVGERERRGRLEELYARAQRLHRNQEWRTVVEVFDEIHALDPEYPDPEMLLRSAREAIELERTVSALYEQGRQHMDAGEWSRAIESLEEVQRLEPGYRQTEALLARARREMIPRVPRGAGGGVEDRTLGRDRGGPQSRPGSLPGDARSKPPFIPGGRKPRQDRPPKLPGW